MLERTIKARHHPTLPTPRAYIFADIDMMEVNLHLSLGLPCASHGARCNFVSRHLPYRREFLKQ